MIAYMDSSAVVRRVLDQPGADVVVDLWDQAATVVSSQVVYPEARAALAAARRAGELDDERFETAACELERLMADLQLVGVDGEQADVAGRLAEDLALPGADAIHLAAALSVDAPRVVVATWDSGLGKASAECGMPVVPAVAG